MEVNTYTGYVVNGFKFQTEVHCRRKSTSNFGVSIKGTGLTQFESKCFGTLQEVVEVEYPNDPIKKVVLFKCEWFDPTLNVGSRLNSEYGIAEVHCKKRSKKYDPFIIAQSASQVCYIPYPQGIKEKMNWWVVLNVQPRGTIDSTYSSSYSYQQQNIMLPTYGGSQSIEDDVQDLVHKPLQMNEVELTQSENQGSDERAQTENSEEDDSEEIEEEDNDDFIEDDSGDSDDKDSTPSEDDDNEQSEDDEGLIHVVRIEELCLALLGHSPRLKAISGIRKMRQLFGFWNIFEKRAARRLIDTLQQVEGFIIVILDSIHSNQMILASVEAVTRGENEPGSVSDFISLSSQLTSKFQSIMKKQGCQYGIVPWNSRLGPCIFANKLYDSPQTAAGLLIRVPGKPSIHIRSKCFRPPHSLGKAKDKGTHKLKSRDVVVSSSRLTTWRLCGIVGLKERAQNG
nr:transcription termination factor 4, mitochondrial-like [Ipomoea batatas]